MYKHESSIETGFNVYWGGKFNLSNVAQSNILFTKEWLEEVRTRQSSLTQSDCHWMIRGLELVYFAKASMDENWVQHQIAWLQEIIKTLQQDVKINGQIFWHGKQGSDYTWVPEEAEKEAGLIQIKDNELKTASLLEFINGISWESMKSWNL